MEVTLLLLFAAGVVLVLGLAALLALDFSFSTALSHGQDSVSASVTVSTDNNDKVYAEIPVAAATTVNYTGCAGLPANIKAISVLTDVAMTLTINYASGADDVFSLVAGEPLCWHTKMLLPDPFVNTNAITSFDFNNAGATAGTARVMIGRDSTT